MIRRPFSTVALAGLAFATSVQAANHTTNVQQAAGANWTDPAIWTPNSAPTTGETFEAVAGGAVSPTRLRNPTASTSSTFGGDSLTMDATTEIRFKSGGGDTTTTFPLGGLILNGGVLNTGDAGVTFIVAGNMNVVAPSFINTMDSNNPTIVQSDRAFRFSALISGGGSLTLSLGRISAPAFEIIGTNNPFSGDWIDMGGWLKGTGSGSLGTGNIVINGSVAIPALFDTDYDLSNPTKSLTLSNTSSTWLLDQNYTFQTVSINGTNLAPGTYAEAQLATTFPSNFAAGSNPTSTVTVVPEPAGLGLLLIGGVVLTGWRRRGGA